MPTAKMVVAKARNAAATGNGSPVLLEWNPSEIRINIRLLRPPRLDVSKMFNALPNASARFVMPGTN
jgi:hypothetical protein